VEGVVLRATALGKSPQRLAVGRGWLPCPEAKWRTGAVVGGAGPPILRRVWEPQQLTQQNIQSFILVKFSG